MDDSFEFEAKEIANEVLINEVKRKKIIKSYVKDLRKHVGITLTDEGPWLCGGAARNFYQDKEVLVSDFDLYFKNEEQWAKAVKQLKDLDYASVFTSENAESFVRRDTLKCNPRVSVQAIRKVFCPTLQDVLTDFDFTVCAIATDAAGNFAFVQQFKEDEENKVLRLQKDIDKHFLKRWSKYLAYVYDFPPGELAKIMRETTMTFDVSRGGSDYD